MVGEREREDKEEGDRRRRIKKAITTNWRGEERVKERKRSR